MARRTAVSALALGVAEVLGVAVALGVLGVTLITTVAGCTDGLDGVEEPIGGSTVESAGGSAVGTPSGDAIIDAPASEVDIILTLPPSEVRVFDPSARSRSQRIEDLAESVGATIEGDTAEITLEESILFEFGSDELRPAAAPVLDDVADLLDELGADQIDVTGHTDSVGDDDFNLDLSRRRAEAVAVALIERGTDAAAIDTEGRGEAEPVTPNETADGQDDPDGRARNRRVEIVATGLAE